MLKRKLIIVSIFTIIFITGCSQSVEKQIIGTWKAISDKCDTDISGINEEITFYEDNTILGIKGFNEYKFQETKEEDYNYIVLSGGYEDVTNFRYEITSDNILKLVNNNYDDDFSEITACHMQKVSE